jgi:hypothetical protein
MRRDDQRLSDILGALDWIARAVAGRTEADFLADDTLCYAVAQRLAVCRSLKRSSLVLSVRRQLFLWADDNYFSRSTTTIL